VTFLNRKGERKTYSIKDALELEDAHEMKKKFKYTKDILSNMIKANAGIKLRLMTDEDEPGSSQPGFTGGP